MDGNKGEQPKDITETRNLEEIERARSATEQIMLQRVDSWEELNAETEQKGNEKFNEKLRAFWKEFVVHGMVITDIETKKPKLLNFSDIDGKCAMKLLALAGFNTQNIQYVEPGASKDKAVNLDTSDNGGIYGLVVKDKGETVFLDHHTTEAGKLTSATEITYETLCRLGLLKKEQYSDRLVQFVTQVDNCDYAVRREDFENSYKRLLGLYRFIPAENLFKFFRDNRDPGKDLNVDSKDPKNDLKKLDLLKGPLGDRSKEQKKVVDESLKELKRMEKEGFIINSKDYGEIAIDIGKKVKAGNDAARAVGCKAYIIWSPEENSFFVTARKPLPYFPQGIRVRGMMHLKPKVFPSGRHGEPLTLTLGELLDKMTGGEIWTTATGELKKYLEEEKKKKEQKQ